MQLGDITFANVHLSHGQLLNRRQLARIASALKGKPSAIIGAEPATKTLSPTRTARE